VPTSDVQPWELFVLIVKVILVMLHHAAGMAIVQVALHQSAMYVTNVWT